MLRRLRLKQFVILEEAAVEFGAGLNAVTGETGTGKSILIDAIGFLAGGRGEVSWVREGADLLAVEGDFDLARIPSARAALASIGLEDQPAVEVRIRRELSSSGRSRAWVAERPVKISELRTVAGSLVSIHGQGEHRRLLEPAAQLEILDRHAGLLELREAYRRARESWMGKLAEGGSIRSRLASLAEKEEWHRAQLEEITEAAVEPGEEARLREEKDRRDLRLRSLETRVELDRILFEDEGSAWDRLETALARVERLEGPEWEEVRSSLRAAREALRGSRRSLSIGNELEEDNPRAVEERLGQLSRLKKKYGGSEEAILERGERLASLLDETARLRERAETIEREIDHARDACAAVAARLGRARRRSAPGLAAAVTREIRELGMAGAELTIRLETEEADAGEVGLPAEGSAVRSFPDGCDRALFLLCPNPGEGTGALGAIASGGELSRALLAILTVLGHEDEPHTAIFDEVDAGIGGATAAAVARRLARLAASRQVLLVTHLPIVASRATTHLRVEKRTLRGRTRASILVLDREERIGELARMLAGEVDSRIARRHAEALIEGASSSKEDG